MPYQLVREAAKEALEAIYETTLPGGGGAWVYWWLFLKGRPALQQLGYTNMYISTNPTPSNHKKNK